MNNNMTDNRTSKLVLTALMMCIIMIATMFIKLPIPFTQGYVHLGDAMIFLSVILLGKKHGAVAAGLGSALGDILGGFAFWAPWTLFIKFAMAFIFGMFMEQKEEGKIGSAAEFAGMIISCAVMVLGYYVAEGLMYGNWIAPLVGILWNIGQFAVGMVVAKVIAAALLRAPIRI